MKWKYLAAAFICLFVIGSFTSCSFQKEVDEENSTVVSEEKKAEETQENVQEEESVKIGVTFDSMEPERRETEQKVMEETFQKLGAVADIQSAEGDVEIQKEQIRQFTEESVNVIIVTAVDCSALEEEIRNARNQGIPSISK